MIDPDYDLLCGQARIRNIYHFGGWYEVVATDIGRAPQPEPMRGDERLDPEPMPPGKPPPPKPPPPPPPRRKPKRYVSKVDYAQVDKIMEQRREMWIAEIASMTSVSLSTLQSYFWRNKSRYRMEKVRQGNGLRRLIVRMR